MGVYAEYVLGAAKRAKSLLGVWWGTGVGGGLVLDGKKWEGRGSAGELGHVVVKIDGAAVHVWAQGLPRGLRRARGHGAARASLHKRGHKTDLFKIMKSATDPAAVGHLGAGPRARGSELATELIDRAIEALGAGIASAVNLLDVSNVVVGGGLGTRLGEPYVKRIREAMQPHLFVDENPPTVASVGARRPRRRDGRRPAGTGRAGEAGKRSRRSGVGRRRDPGTRWPVRPSGAAPPPAWKGAPAGCSPRTGASGAPSRDTSVIGSSVGSSAASTAIARIA